MSLQFGVCMFPLCNLQVLPTGHGHTLSPFFFLDKRYWAPHDHSSSPPGSIKSQPGTGHSISIPEGVSRCDFFAAFLAALNFIQDQAIPRGVMI
jgi:hypothetical protein